MSKLMALLKNLDKTELKNLDLWLRSPLHNTSEEAAHLYTCIRKKHLQTGKPIEHRMLLKYIGIKLPRSKKNIPPQDERKLTHIMHLLTVQVLKFMTWQEIEKETILCKYYLMHSLLERKLYRYVSSTLTKAKKEHETYPYQDIRYCENAFQLVKMEFYLDMLTQNRSTKTGFKDVIDRLRQAYLSKALKYYCAAINSEKILKIKQDYPLLNAVMQHLSKSEADKKNPFIRLYYGLLKLLIEEKETDYYSLKVDMLEHLDKFDMRDVRQFLNFMTNYCTFAIRTGKSTFIEEKHQLYERGIALKCWSWKIFFSAHQFVQIVKNALMLNKTEWATNFIEEHEMLMDPKVRENTLYYTKALVAFRKKDFDAAQKELGKICSTEDFLYHIDYKILLIKIYHDSEDMNSENLKKHPINSLIEAIRQYVLVYLSQSLGQKFRKFKEYNLIIFLS